MQAGVGAVIASVVYDMAAGVIREKDGFRILIMVLAFVATCFFQVNVIYVVIVCGAIGVIQTYIRKRKEKR